METSRNSNVALEKCLDGYTLGMEYDCGDFDRDIDIPEGSQYCDEEVSAHTIKGISVDPFAIYNRFGGELQLKPTDSEEACFKEIDSILNLALPDTPDHSATTIHMHIRVPAFVDDHELLLDFLKWNDTHWPRVRDYVYYAPYVSVTNDWIKWDMELREQCALAVYSASSLRRATYAKSSKEMACYLHNRVPHDGINFKGEQWLPTRIFRPAVNASHFALSTETLEFRAFRQTRDREVLRNIIDFPRQYLECWATNKDPLDFILGTKYFTSTDYTLGHTARSIELRKHTTMYTNNWSDVEKYLEGLLKSGEITIADLNYPQHWIDKGYQ
jgi:hypothetical protein